MSTNGVAGDNVNEGLSWGPAGSSSCCSGEGETGVEVDERAGKSGGEEEVEFDEFGLRGDDRFVFSFSGKSMVGGREGVWRCPCVFGVWTSMSESGGEWKSRGRE